MLSEVETAPHAVFVAENKAFEHLAGHEKQDRDSAAGRSKPKKAVGRLEPEDFELLLSDPLLRDGFMSWPLWETNTVGFVPGADVMLPVVHLIPQLSALKQNGLDFETPHSLTITFVKEKKEWVVETDLSYVGSPDLKSCTKKCITIPSDGGSFLLHMSRWKEPRIFADCVFRLAIRRKDVKKRTYLDLMPPEALRLVASHLSPDDVLNTLLLVRPSFFEDLRNGVAWPKLDHWNLVEHARHVMLASADTVRLLWIDYSPVGRHVTEKWQRVALGKELKTIVVENVDLVKGKRFSSSVNELRYEFPAPSDEEYGTVLWKNVWDDFLPSAPAPIIESVSVGLAVGCVGTVYRNQVPWSSVWLRSAVGTRSSERSRTRPA
jgi:hypothetical protein